MRKYFILFLLLVSALVMRAENASNVRIRQEGKSIIITYDLSKRSVVRVLMSSNNSGYYTELKAVSGNIGKGVPAGKARKIVWYPLEENGEFVAKNVRFKVEALSSYDYYTQNAKVKTLVMGQVGYSVAPQLSYGGMIGQMYNGIGWYANFRSNFNFMAKTNLECDEKGAINREVPFYTGNKQSSHLVITGGFMMNFLEKTAKNKFNTFGMYVGGGYGKRELQWEILGGKWVKYAPTSSIGFSGNFGLFGSVSGLTFSVGFNTIKFEYVDVVVGVGFMF
jgi:hypothetical protein